MRKIIVLNHKSYLKNEQAKSYPININNFIRNDQTVIICPSSIYIPYFKGKYNFKLGSQTIESDNITGELTGEILKSLEVKYTLIGTNDRKNKYEETPKQINKKVKEAIKYNIRPIITIGETFYEKELNKTLDVLTKELKEYLKDIEVKQDIIICYYPNWKYKGKQVPSITYIEEVIGLIKNIIKHKYNANIKVIYGGNVSIDNIEKLDEISNNDGYLIEKPSTNLKEIINLLNGIE